MTIITFDPLVPEFVRLWATEQTSFVADKARHQVVARIHRLVWFGTGKGLWRPLLALCAKEPTLDLLGLLQAAVSAPAEFRRLSKTPVNEVRSDAKHLSVTAVKLANSLRGLIKKVSFQNRQALSTYSIALASAGKSKDPLVQTLIHDEELQSALLNLERYLPDIPDLVVGLSAVISSVATDEGRIRPHRMNALNAERTFVIVTLKRYVLRSTKQPATTLLANIVNLALDRTDTTGDTVRKTPC